MSTGPGKRLLQVTLWGTVVAVLIWLGTVGPLNHRVTPVSWMFAARPARPSVVLIVLDTVGADHASVCGYERPTTPTLEALVGEGFLSTCRAYTPGSWTLPVHASFFTGLSVPEHGVSRARGLLPLDDAHTTLAEGFRARGYQTVAVSQNPILTEDTGILRGFDYHYTVEERDFALQVHLTNALRWHTSAGKPLFLFVNIFDAHDPWDGVPTGEDWVPAREPFEWYCDEQADCPTRPYLRGEMNPQEEETFRSRAVDNYDWAIRKADALLADTLRIIEDHGWISPDARIAIVSDHGELLAQHGEVAHGQFAYESLVRVPFLYRGRDVEELPPGPFNAVLLYDLLLQGSLPEHLPDIATFAFPDPRYASWAERESQPDHVAVWHEQHKLLWTGEGTVGSTRHFDVVADPEETHPLRTPAPSPLREALLRALEAHDEARSQGDEAEPRSLSEDTLNRLRSLGYIGLGEDPKAPAAD